MLEYTPNQWHTPTTSRTRKDANEMSVSVLVALGLNKKCKLFAYIYVNFLMEKLEGKL